MTQGLKHSIFESSDCNNNQIPYVRQNPIQNPKPCIKSNPKITELTWYGEWWPRGLPLSPSATLLQDFGAEFVPKGAAADVTAALPPATVV